VVRRITLSWPYSIAAILMLMVMLAMAALATLGVFASTANAQANGGNPPDVECAEAGGEFAGKFEGPAESGTRPVNVGGAVMVSFKISGDTLTYYSEFPMKFILVVKGGQLTEEFGPTRKGTFTLSNGQDIDHVTFCVPLKAGSSVVATASPTGAPIAAGGGGGGGQGTTIQAGGGASGSLVPIPDGGGPSILLPAASLLLGSGILTYAILRRG
jgi:hypothetical protein